MEVGGDDRLLIWRLFLERVGKWLGFVEIGNHGSRARLGGVSGFFCRGKCA